MPVDAPRRSVYAPPIACCFCGVPIVEFYDGGWKRTPDGLDFFAHHSCGVRNPNGVTVVEAHVG